MCDVRSSGPGGAGRAPFGGAVGVLIRSGGDLLSRTLRCSTIGGAALNGRVRDGIGCVPAPMAAGPDQDPRRRSPAPARGKASRSVPSQGVEGWMCDFLGDGGLMSPARRRVGSSLLDD